MLTTPMTLLSHTPDYLDESPLIHGGEQRSDFLRKHPEGIVLTSGLRMQIAMALGAPDVPIVIEGETGTGKEQVVKYIHSRMNKASNVPLVVLNCANLKKELAAATLFGHKKGAFTGAVESTMGAVGRAHNGILFLDEFQRLDGSIQEQILRTLQDGSYQRVGDHAEQYSNFRLVIATPKSLEQMALDGEILLDLRFRLYGVEIRIPPLRERRDQMGDFIDCFLANSERKIVLSAEERVKLIRRCSEFSWQGNIRQLFGVLRLLVIQASAQGKPILAADLPVYPTMLAPGLIPIHAVRKGSEEPLFDLVRAYSERPTDYEEFIDAFERTLLTRLSFQYPQCEVHV